MEHALEPAAHTSSLPGASASGDTSTSKPSDAPPVRLPLIDGLAAEILARVMAGLITRTQAREVAAGTLHLGAAVEVHVPIHKKIGATPHTILSFRSAEELRAAHAEFKKTLRSLDAYVQHAFSNGRLTLCEALYAHRMELTRPDIRRYVADGWESHTPNIRVWAAPFQPYVKPIPRRLREHDADDDKFFSYR